jgi:hypothetical protein
LALTSERQDVRMKSADSGRIPTKKPGRGGGTLVDVVDSELKSLAKSEGLNHRRILRLCPVTIGLPSVLDQMGTHAAGRESPEVAAADAIWCAIDRLPFEEHRWLLDVAFNRKGERLDLEARRLDHRTVNLTASEKDARREVAIVLVTSDVSPCRRGSANASAPPLWPTDPSPKILTTLIRLMSEVRQLSDEEFARLFGDFEDPGEAREVGSTLRGELWDLFRSLDDVERAAFLVCFGRQFGKRWLPESLDDRRRDQYDGMELGGAPWRPPGDARFFELEARVLRRIAQLLAELLQQRREPPATAAGVEVDPPTAGAEVEPETDSAQVGPEDEPPPAAPVW